MRNNYVDDWSLQEVVVRFESQGETQRHLEELKTDNDRVISQLSEERDQLLTQFTDMKYSGEAKLSRLGLTSAETCHMCISVGYYLMFTANSSVMTD